MEPPSPEIPDAARLVELAEKKLEQEQSGWLPGLRWNPTSFRHLRGAEDNIMQFVSVERRAHYVDVGPVVRGTGPSNHMWTLSFSEHLAGVPLVMVHGFASGVGLWCLNYDALAADRPVHAFDNIGFGRSSRPRFSKDPEKVEQQFVDSLEAWRQRMGLEKMILLGHSLGGYLSCAYALQHPERLEHLILADPWGFSEPPDGQAHRPSVPVWVRAVLSVAQMANPLSILRLSGPWGSTMIEKVRPDLMRKFSTLVVSPPNQNYMANYIYHCNAQSPTGEGAFQTLSSQLGWAQRPMLKRVDQLDPMLPITCIFGSRSWIDNCGHKMRAERPPGSYLDVETILGASHHVYADRPEVFNELVLAACTYTRTNLARMLQEQLQDPQPAGFFLREGEDADAEDQAAALRDDEPSAPPAVPPAAAPPPAADAP